MKHRFLICIAKLRGFHLTSGNTALAIHGMRSEDAEKGSTLSDGAATGKMFDDFEYLASNGMIKSYWNDNYSLIHKVNDLLDEMSQNPSLTEGDLVNKGKLCLYVLSVISTLYALLVKCL